MPLGEIILFIGALVVMLVGLAGVILPVLPGAPLILGAAFVYGLITHFREITWNIIGVFVLLTVISLFLDWLATTYGVKKMGGSFLGMLGAFLGMTVGLFTAGLVGLIVGSFLGAMAGELLAGKTYQQAIKAGAGSFLGLVVGGVVKFALAAVMVGVFVWKILF